MAQMYKRTLSLFTPSIFLSLQSHLIHFENPAGLHLHSFHSLSFLSSLLPTMVSVTPATTTRIITKTPTHAASQFRFSSGLSHNNNNNTYMIPPSMVSSNFSHLISNHDCALSTTNFPKRLFATFRPRRSSSRNRQQKQPAKNLPLRNEEITAQELRLVFPEGEKPPTKTVSLSDALQEAKSRGLDLVMVSPNAIPPVARLMEWDKVMYTMRQKEKAAEKAARESKKLMVPKEVRIGCHIAEHDLFVKIESMKSFLNYGHTVKLVVTFRGGREIPAARERIDEVLGKLEGIGVLKDPRHLQKPQMNQWVVQVGPSISLTKQ